MEESVRTQFLIDLEIEWPETTVIKPADVGLEPQSMPYGFASGLVVTAPDQRVDTAVAAAPVMMRVRAFALHYMRYWGRFQHRKRIGADRWQSGRRGHTDRANEDHGKNVTHLVSPFGPIGPWP